MLVLTRRLDEKIFIGDSIVITVVLVDCGQVRLGIEAPDDVLILRGELVGQPDRRQPGGDGGPR